MFSGVGIIGALASILASILVPQPKQEEVKEGQPAASITVEKELTAVKTELAALRQLLEQREIALKEPRGNTKNLTSGTKNAPWNQL